MANLNKPISSTSSINPNNRRVDRRRILDMLPGVFQTDVNRKLFGAVVDPVYQPQNTENLIGYVGQIPDYYNPTQDFYIAEPSRSRQFYQLNPIMVSRNLDTNEYQRELFYTDLINYLRFKGGNVENHNRIFSQPYYSWQPPIDLDKFMNFQDYYWIPVGLEPFVITDPTDVENEIIGKTGKEDTIPAFWNQYLSSGTKILLTNDVNSEYNDKEWFIEGVGRDIILIEDDSVVNGWDLYPWDTTLWDELSQISFDPDFVVMERGAYDGNQWSKTNRWFHRDVIQNFYDPDLFKTQATRPIIEFERDLELWNTGFIDRGTVDVVITECPEFYSVIQDFTGGWDNPPWDRSTVGCNYNVGGWDSIWPNRNLGYSEVFIQDAFGDTIQLRDGLIILLTNDKRPGADDRIYEVTGIAAEGRILLQPLSNGVNLDGSPAFGERVTQLSPSGVVRTFWYNGEDWVLGQNKLTINQPPLFQLYDTSGRALDDSGYYPNNNFNGNKVFSYLEDTDPGADVDRVTSFRLVRNSFGEIVFNNDLETEEYSYIDPTTNETLPINGFYFWRIRKILDSSQDEYGNSWNLVPEESRQYYVNPLRTIDQLRVYTTTLVPDLNSIREPLIVKLDGVTLTESVDYIYTPGTNFITLTENPGENKALEIRVISNQTPVINNGFYDLPLNLTANPNNLDIEQIGYNQLFDQFYTGILNQPESDITSPFSRTNYRDSSKIRYLGQNILQHSASMLKLMALASSPEVDIIKSINYVQREYLRFKNKFINKITQLIQTQSVDSMSYGDWVDLAIEELNVAKNTEFPFNISGVGYKQTLSPKRTYIPPTPAYLGITRVFEPGFFEDDTFNTTRRFIQGHDGSLVPAFYDERDNIILELEQRIYESIPSDFKNIDRLPLVSRYDVIPGKWRGTEYSREEILNIFRPSFEIWAAQSGVDYRTNNQPSNANEFSINYSSLRDKDGEELPGNWRAIYFWYYDTDRPHEAPWEMLGFSLKPDWWDAEYGLAPYTSGNTKLWNDLSLGLIRGGSGIGVDSRFARPGLLDYIPVTTTGELATPLEAGIISTLPSPNNISDDWEFGDLGPVETAWFKSEYYPYDLSKLLYFTKPAKFVEFNWDSLEIDTVYSSGIDQSDTQYINTTYGDRPEHSLIVAHGESENTANDVAAGFNFEIVDEKVRHYGLQQFVSNYLINQNKDITTFFGSIVRGLNAQLGHRMAGFIDSNSIRLDTDSFGLIPTENVETLLYKSNSTREVFYSGVIVEKTATGYKVFGYDLVNTVFQTIPGDPNGKKGRIGVGNVGNPYSIWRSNTQYYKGDTVLYEENNTFYRANGDHRSSDTFNPNRWSRVSVPPTKYQLTVTKKFTPQSNNPIQRVVYGTEFQTVQQVFDFLIDYERYLEQQGFIFDQTDTNTGEVIDWTWTGKEFMVWTLADPEPGEVIALSPGATRVKFQTARGYIEPVEQIVQGVYSLLNKNGVRIDTGNTAVSRYENTIEIIPYDETDSNSFLYAARLFITEIEHIIIIDNETIFNDLIYNPQFNIRQPRMRLQTVRALGWNGRYDAAGFIISEDTLLPNYDKLADQFRFIFDTNKSRFVEDLWKDYGYHNIGYQNRDYLNQLIISEKSQLNFYQGMIQQKGTRDSFNKLLRSEFVTRTSDLFFYEEWALRVGHYGGYDKKPSLEIDYNQGIFKQNPQLTEMPRIPVVQVSALPTNVQDGPEYVWISGQENIFRKNAPQTAYETIEVSGGVITSGTLDDPFDSVLKIFTFEDSKTGKVIASDRRWARRPDTTVSDIKNWVFPTRPLGTHQEDLPTAGYIRRDEARYNAFGFDDIVELYASAKESQTPFQDGEIIWVYNANSVPGSKYYNPDFQILPNSVQNQKWTAFRVSEYKRPINNLQPIFIGNEERELSIGFTFKERFTLSADNPTFNLNGKDISETDIILVRDIPASYSPIEEDSFLITGATINVSTPAIVSGTTAYFIDYVESATDLTITERFRTSALSELTLSYQTENIINVNHVTNGFGLSALNNPSIVPSSETEFLINYNNTPVSAGEEILFPDGTVSITVYPEQSGASYWVSYTLNNAPQESQNKRYTERFNAANILSAETFFLENMPILETITVSAAYLSGVSSTFERLDNSDFTVEQNPYIRIQESTPSQNIRVEYTDAAQQNSFVEIFDGFNDEFGGDVRLSKQPDLESVVVLEGTRRETKIQRPQTSTVSGDFFIQDDVLHYTGIISGTADFWIQYLVNDPSTSNIPVQYLSANGTTSAFSINNPPLRESSILVVENGLVQFNNADYIVSSANSLITFSTPPEEYTWIQHIADDVEVSGFFTTVTDESLSYTLNREALTNGVLVTLDNNILEPGEEFTVSANVLTFTDRPPLNSTLQVRYIVPTPAIQQNDIVIFDNVQSEDRLEYEGIFRVLGTGSNSDIRISLPSLTGSTFQLTDTFIEKVFVLQELRFPSFESYVQHTNTAKYGNTFGGPSEGQLVFIDDSRSQSDKPHRPPKWGVFNLDPNAPSWNVSLSTRDPIRKQQEKINTGLFYNARIYDKNTNELKTDIDIYDPVKNKIPGIAEKEIWYKLDYDPAKYNQGDRDLHQVDLDQHWGPAQVGRVWWDLRTVRYLDYEIDDNTYRRDNWGRIAPGSSIDLYEWVRSPLSPEDYAAEAEDADEIVANTVSDIPSGEIYSPDSPAYVAQEEYNPETGDIQTFYYFWVKNKITLPPVDFRENSVKLAANIITNPTSQGIIWAAPINENALAVSNAFEFINDSTVLQFNWNLDFESTNWHKQWVLGRDGDPSYIVDNRLYSKMVDSLVGYDSTNRVVPDPILNEVERYGTLFRPRQTMFVNRIRARENLLEITNSIFENINFIDERFDYPDTFNLEDSPPDTVVVDGRRVPIDHNVADISQRNFLQESGTITPRRGNNIVLVDQNPSTGNFWTIWKLVDNTPTWELIEAQKYKTTDFYSFANYYADGVDKTKIPLKQYADIAERDVALQNGLIVDGDRILVEDVNGSWQWQDYVDGSFVLVAKQGSTLALSSKFVTNNIVYGINEDWPALTETELLNKVTNRDGSLELRKILEAFEDSNVIQNDELNRIFFTMVRYAMSENQVVDWAFKTSYILFGGFIENLGQDTVLRPALFESLLDYITEVKPYHVKFREYARRIATAVDTYSHDITDFDNPVWFDETSGSYRPLDPENETDQEVLETKPWVYWYNNYLDNPNLIRNFTITEKFDRVGCRPELIEQDPNSPGTINTPESIRIFADGVSSDYDLVVNNLEVTTFPAVPNYRIFKLNPDDPFLPTPQVWSKPNIREVVIKNPVDGVITTINSNDWDIIEVTGSNPPFDNHLRLLLYTVIPPAGNIIEIRHKILAADRLARYYTPITTLWNGEPVQYPLPELDYDKLISGCSFRGTRVEGGTFTADPFDTHLQIKGIDKDSIRWEGPDWDTFNWDGTADVLNTLNFPNTGFDYTYDAEVSGGYFESPNDGPLSHIIEGNTFIQPGLASDHPEELVIEKIINPLGITVHTQDYPGAPKTKAFKSFSPIKTGTEFPIPLLAQSREAVFVFVDEVLLREDEDYTVDWNNQKIVMSNGYPNQNHKVEIIAYSHGGKYIANEESRTAVITVSAEGAEAWGINDLTWGAYNESWGGFSISFQGEWGDITNDWGDLNYFWSGAESGPGADFIEEEIFLNIELGEQPIIITKQYLQVRDKVPGTTGTYRIEADPELLQVLNTIGFVFCTVNGHRSKVLGVNGPDITIELPLNSNPEHWIIFTVFTRNNISATVYTTHYDAAQQIPLINRSGPENEIDSTLIFVDGLRQIGPKIRYLDIDNFNPSPTTFDIGFDISGVSALEVYVNDVEIDQYNLVSTSSIQITQNIPANSIVKVIDFEGSDYTLTTVTSASDFTAAWSTLSSSPTSPVGTFWDQFAWDFNADDDTLFLVFNRPIPEESQITVITFNNNSSMGIKTEYFEGKIIPNYYLAFDPYINSNIWATVDRQNKHWNFDYSLLNSNEQEFNGVWEETENLWANALPFWSGNDGVTDATRITFLYPHVVLPEKLGFDPSVSINDLISIPSQLSAGNTWQDLLDLWANRTDFFENIDVSGDVTLVSAFYEFGFDEDWFDGGLPTVYKKPVYITYMTDHQKEDGYSFKYFQPDDPYRTDQIDVIKTPISSLNIEPIQIASVQIDRRNISVRVSSATSATQGTFIIDPTNYTVDYNLQNNDGTFVTIDDDYVSALATAVSAGISNTSDIKISYKVLELKDQEYIRIGANNNFEVWQDASANSDSLQILHRKTLPALFETPTLMMPNRDQGVPGTVWVGASRVNYWELSSGIQTSAGTIYTISGIRSGTKHTPTGVTNSDEYVRIAADGSSIQFTVSGISQFTTDDITISLLEYIKIPGIWSEEPNESWDEFAWDTNIAEGQDTPYTVKTSADRAGDYIVVGDTITFSSAPPIDPLHSAILTSGTSGLLNNILISLRSTDFRINDLGYKKGTPVINASKVEQIPGGYMEMSVSANVNQTSKFQEDVINKFLLNRKQQRYNP